MTVTKHKGSELSVTQRRVASLRQVRDNLVAYDTGRAVFLVDGVPVTGWDWRTLSELRTAEWIKITGRSGIARVQLTRSGDKILMEATH